METVVFAENRSAHVRPGVIVPTFGGRCVCCDAETSRTQLYDPSTDRILCDEISVPVCADCRGHAMITPNGSTAPALVLLIGIVLGGIGIYREATIMIAIGITAVAAALSWIAVVSVRAGRWRRAGHHPAMTMNVESGRCVLRTTNVALIDELVATNRFARRRPGRGGRDQLPAARVVSPTETPDPDALTPEEKARLLAETLGQRPR